MTWEHDLHLYFRRVISNEVLYGSPELHQRALVDIAERTNGVTHDRRHRGAAAGGPGDESVAEFRARARAWLAEHVPLKVARRAVPAVGRRGRRP